MRKRITQPGTADAVSPPSDWLDLEQLAEVEITSEDPNHPIESALQLGDGPGWRAGEPGKQVIRLHFDVAHDLRRIRLVFQEPDAARTQEFALRWAAEAGGPYREVLRQQYNFSPTGETREIEEYEVDLPGVSSLELEILPEIGGGEHRASLAEWRLA